MAYLKTFAVGLTRTKCGAVGHHAVALADTIESAFPFVAERVAAEPPRANVVIAVSGDAVHRAIRFQGHRDRKFVVRVPLDGEFTAIEAVSHFLAGQEIAGRETLSSDA